MSFTPPPPRMRGYSFPRNVRVVASVALGLVALACNKPKESTSSEKPALQAPVTVPHALCPVTIPLDSEIVEAKETSFTVKIKGGRELFDPSIMVVNQIVSVYSKTRYPDAQNLKFTVDEKLAGDGYALEGEFEQQGKKYYFVERSIPCAPKAWLDCSIRTINPKDAAYASRVCRNLVPAK